MKNNNRDSNSGRTQTSDFPQGPPKLMTASSLTGYKVYNNEREQLGKISDVLLNIGNGRIQSVIVEHDGFVGAGRKYFTIRLEALIIDTEGHNFILDQSRADFENNPAFDENKWPKGGSHKRYSRSAKDFGPTSEQ